MKTKKNYLFLFFLLFLFINNNKVSSEEKNFVSLINCYFDEKSGFIVISWETIDNPRAFYKIYRLSDPLKGKNFVPLQSSLVKTVDFNVSQTFDRPSETGKYYYFVSVVMDDKENTAILSDQNYTFNPVDFFAASGIVQNIKAKFIPQNSEIWINWEKPAEGEKIKSFKIYRSTQSINENTINIADKVGEIPSDNTVYLDKVNTQGKFFYAVTAVSIYNYENPLVVSGTNSLSKPVSVISLDSKKLPEFYITFPVSIQFRFQPEIQWNALPDTLKHPPLELEKIYPLKEPVVKKEENTEEEKKETLTPEELKKEIDEVNTVFNTRYKKKEYKEFLTDAESLSKKLKSNFVQKKLLFYQAVMYYRLNEKKKAKLMIEEVKADKIFMKYNKKEVLLLERKIQDK
ncbi:MAG: hypothetical protein A2Y41_03875 [Spirochaetes bacterium GWB1_36_13]|nr:MAG: hypothetical protein A2Y41_03875 [Spirochaetes bacterium GWB1_36_13]